MAFNPAYVVEPRWARRFYDKDSYYWRRTYKEYMHSVTWQERKRRVIERDGNECAFCGCSEDLQVHHISYKSIGDEKNRDLITLCESCHYVVHDESLWQDLRLCRYKREITQFCQEFRDTIKKPYARVYNQPL